jgi:TRAP-type C4-dicarboxylate transport system permease small subunit
VLFLGLALINFNNQQNYTGFNIALSYVCTGLLIFILLLLVFEVFCRSLFKLKSEEEIRK